MMHKKRLFLLFQFGNQSEILNHVSENVDEDKFCDIICNIPLIKKLNLNFLAGELYTMYVKDVTVQNLVGLHARPATFFIQKANEYKSSIWVEKEERRVNAKSLLGVLSLGIMGGTSIRIIADGSDEESAVEGLVKIVQTGFTE